VRTEVATFCEQQLTKVRESGALSAFDGAAPALRESLPRVLAASDFVADCLRRDPGLANWLIEEGGMDRVLAAGEMGRRLAAALADQPDLAGFMAVLRRQRMREMVRIAWRDLAGWAGVPETLAETSAFADAAIEAAVEYASQDLARTWGEPRSVAGEVQPLIVIGMGKLGGGELNFSSDIDLIFVFPEKGETSGGRSIDNEDFFKIGRASCRERV